MIDLAFRSLIYDQIIKTEKVPLRSDLLELSDDPDGLDDQLRRLHDAHLIVLDDRPDRHGEIRMALPFSADPTDFRVETRRGSWFANCAWDSLAVAAALHDDAQITSTWIDTGEAFQLDIVGGLLDGTDGFIHFELPAGRWWDDIVET